MRKSGNRGKEGRKEAIDISEDKDYHTGLRYNT